MMDTLPFTTLNQPCDQSVDWAISQLEQAGLQTVKTFDLRTGPPGNAGCSCASAQTHPCDCHMVVLLVYQGMELPATLMVQGCREKSWLSLPHAAQQTWAENLGKRIQAVLQPTEAG